MHFRVFSHRQCTEWGYIGISKISIIFGGMPDILNLW